MKITKDKRAEEGIEHPLGEIIGWIILFALIMFVFLWYSGLGTKITALFKSIT